jgi:flagellar basal-body rod protein FlgG
MLEALQIAATGMQAQQLNVDTIANNLANANTAGYKRGRVAFHDLVTRVADASIAAGGVRPLDPVPLAGIGVGVASVSRQFDAGELRRTDSPYDVAISGDGFIELALADGTRAYTRGGTLKVNADGLLAIAGGPALAGAIAVPEHAQSLVVEGDGRVLARLAGSAQPVELGQIALVRFVAPGALAPLGNGLYRATDASGEAIAARAGDESVGELKQGHVEASNVKMVDEMVNLMVAQRAYEASVNVARAADEMLAMVNNLRK